MPQANAKGLVYRSRETHAAVQSDPALVALILRNLVSNAIRYTERGSVFRLVLPMARVAVVRDEFEATQNTTHALNVRVLVIDDDEAMRADMLQLLRGWVCACEAAESIEEALALARVHPPGLVISDYRLREARTDAQAIAALRAEFGPQLPALMITGDTAPERLREARTSGVPLLHKPVAPDELHRALASVLGERRRGKPELQGVVQLEAAAAVSEENASF